MNQTVLPVGITSSLFNAYQDGTGKKMSAQDMIVYCARVSNPKNQNSDAPAEKLLKYLIEHKHWSPFEMVDMVMEINTTRDIARQILRHRSFSFQEFSQRYADPTKTWLCTCVKHVYKTIRTVRTLLKQMMMN